MLLGLFAVACRPAAPTRIGEPSTSSSSPSSGELAFDLSDAVAFAHVGFTDEYGFGGGDLVKILPDGAIELAVSAPVTWFEVISGGRLLIDLSDGDSGVHLLGADGADRVLDVPQNPVHLFMATETDSGVLVFNDGSLVDPETGDVDVLAPVDPFEFASPTNVSRDLISVEHWSVRSDLVGGSVTDVATGASVPLPGATPIAALSDAVALVYDGDDQALLDLESGAGSAAPFDRFAEALPDDEGAVVLDSGCPSDGTGSGAYRLCHVSPTGEITAIWRALLDPVAPRVERNSVLAGDGDFYVVAETTGITVIDADGNRSVASDVVASKVTVGADHIAYYVGTDRGSPTLGRIDLVSGSATEIADDQWYTDVEPAR